MQNLMDRIPESMKQELFGTKFEVLQLCEIFGKLVYIPKNERLDEVMSRYPDADQATGLLGYVYIDHEEGLNIEIIANARLQVRKKWGDHIHLFTFFSPDRLRHETMHFDQFDFESTIFLPSKIFLYSQEILKQVRDCNMRYCSDRGQNLSRQLAKVDPLRHCSYPDEFVLFLADSHGELTPVWARFEYVRQDGIILASLRDKPDPKFGLEDGQPVSVQLLPEIYHEGSLISFPVHYYGHAYDNDLEDFYRNLQELRTRVLQQAEASQPDLDDPSDQETSDLFEDIKDNLPF